MSIDHGSPGLGPKGKTEPGVPGNPCTENSAHGWGDCQDELWAVPLVVNLVLHGCGFLRSLSGPSIRASHHTDLGMRPTGMGESH